VIRVSLTATSAGIPISSRAAWLRNSTLPSTLAMAMKSLVAEMSASKRRSCSSRRDPI